jgi:hypothetical protein
MLPILVLCFIRLDSLKQTLESIFSQDHGPIYISCDAPPYKYLAQGAEVQRYIKSLLEAGKIEEIRISNSNQGVLEGVTSGVSWFFERVNKGIVLEDDLILQSNFLKSVELASKYLDQPNVIAIGLHNMVPKEFISHPQLILRSSRFVISWGWVTTQENWQSRIKTYQEVDYLKLFVKMLPQIGLSSSLYHLYYYRKSFVLEKTDIKKCMWADLWQINAFMKKSIVLTFNKNFVLNMGFGELATNTKNKNADYSFEVVSKSDIDENNYRFEIQNIDRTAEKYFIRNRRISTIARSEIRLRTRLKNSGQFQFLSE